MVLARKAVRQNYSPSERVLDLMEDYRNMTNDSIRIGMDGEVSSLKRLSMLTYKHLKRYEVPSCYKLCAISKASGILSSRKKSIKRVRPTRDP